MFKYGKHLSQTKSDQGVANRFRSSSSMRQSIATLNASTLTSGIDPRNRGGDSQSIRLCATEVTTKIEARTSAVWA